MEAAISLLTMTDWVPDLAGELLDALRGVRRVTSVPLTYCFIVLELGQPSGRVLTASPAAEWRISAVKVSIALCVGLNHGTFLVDHNVARSYQSCA